MNGTDQQSGYGGGRMICMEDVGSSTQGAKGARSKGELAHHQGFTYVQTASKIQHQSNGEGAEYGSAGAHTDSVLRDGEELVITGTAGDDGMEVEEGSKASSCSC